MKKESLESTLSIFIEERLQDNYKNILKNSLNKKIINNHYSLFNELKNTINNTNLLETYRKAEIDSYTLQLQEAYKLGFIDCINILNQ